MKTKQLLFGLMATGLLAVSCSDQQAEEEGKELTYDEKVEEVCNCFDEKQQQGQPPKDCFMLQGKYEADLNEEKKVEFIQKTNECAP